MNIYREQLLDHYQNPRNFGKLEQATSVSTNENVSCGDTITVFLKINSKNIVEKMMFDGEGCAVSIASASLLSEYVVGKAIITLKKLTIDDLLKIIGAELTPSRIKCAALSLSSLQQALNNFR
ncbi:MAG: iron-sulfur cluster assembly scaffold protein [bacterium]